MPRYRAGVTNPANARSFRNTSVPSVIELSLAVCWCIECSSWEGTAPARRLRCAAVVRRRLLHEQMQRVRSWRIGSAPRLPASKTISYPPNHGSWSRRVWFKAAKPRRESALDRPSCRPSSVGVGVSRRRWDADYARSVLPSISQASGPSFLDCRTMPLRPRTLRRRTSERFEKVGPAFGWMQWSRRRFKSTEMTLVWSVSVFFGYRRPESSGVVWRGQWLSWWRRIFDGPSRSLIHSKMNSAGRLSYLEKPV